MLADIALGAGAAFCFAILATPVGVSGAVFLVPVQISVLRTPSPAVTPTNLLYNLVMGLGGLAGAYLGARIQTRLPERLLRRGLGLLALALGLRYALQALF